MFSLNFFKNPCLVFAFVYNSCSFSSFSSKAPWIWKDCRPYLFVLNWLIVNLLEVASLVKWCESHFFWKNKKTVRQEVHYDLSPT